MIKIAICDDENAIVNIIEDMLESIAKQEGLDLEISVFYDGATLEESFLMGEKFDLIYLDIQMKIQDGITAAKNIRKMDKNVLIVYVSGYEKYVYELFEVDAFDFIRKPIDKYKFEKCFKRAYDKICNYAVYFEFKYKNEWFKIAFGEILYFRSKGRKIHIYLLDGSEELFNEKLNEVEDKIKNSKIPFLRIHQSYLVNYNFIRSLTKIHVRLINNRSLPISDERQKDICEKYGKLLGGEISE